MRLKVQKPRGMKDLIYPDSEIYLKLRDLIIDFSLFNGFKYIETPIVEDIKTFTSSLGESSDVVMKEMFLIKGKDKGNNYVLRPEGTAGVVRAYFENGMQNLPQPVNLFYFGKMYRRERPQYGRLREHTQWGLEILNSSDSFADFYIMFIVHKFFVTKLKINKITLKINSLGCEKCRPRYKRALINYYKKFKSKICLDCQKRLKLNPLRLLDCKNEKDQDFKLNAPNILDFICKNCKMSFQKLLEYLDHFKIPYDLDKNLVRGFDYYEKTVFEVFFESENIALGGGGRYDLGKIFAGFSLPSVGCAIGIERLLNILEKTNLKTKIFKITKPDFFIAFASEEIRNKAFMILNELQQEGIKITSNFFKSSLSAQLDLANKLGVKYVLILGFQEWGKNELILKNMETGVQEILKLKNLGQELKKIIKEN